MSREEYTAIRIAEIVGPSSGAAKAVAELLRRRRAGETVAIWREGNRWIVGPPSPTTTPDSLGDVMGGES